MAKRIQTKGTRAVYVELPEEVMDALDTLAGVHGISRTGELLMAIRRHLAYPPVFDVPPLPVSVPDEVIAEVTAQRRGRPRKAVEK